MGHWEKEGRSNEWYTPKYVFDALGCVFDMDVASPEDRSLITVPAKVFLTANSLDTEWSGFVWMNPPFGGRNGLVPWLNKIIDHGNGIALTPDRTSTPWWQIAAQCSDAHMQISKKVKFINKDGYIGEKPGNGVTLFAFGDCAVSALLNAQKNGLGRVFKQIH